MSIARILYPAKCALCERLGEPPICSTCRGEIAALGEPAPVILPQGLVDHAAVAAPYEGRAAQAVRFLKYRRETSLSEVMAELLALRIAERGWTSFDLIVPVPIHWTRLFHRGFNQAFMIADAMYPGRVSESALKRIRRTRPQVALSPAKRLSNLRMAFRAEPEVSGKNVLLIDDVITTGGTVIACANALRSAGAKVVCAAAFAGQRMEPW